MSSAAVGSHHHGGAGPLSLMSCVRESSPLQDYEPPDNEKGASKRKFWKKWFKRKSKVPETVVPVEIVDREDVRSRSTSELSISDDQIRRRSGSSMHPGLSVSHDSVFHSPNSGSDMELDAAQSSSSLSISQPRMESRLKRELSERLRLRRSRGDTSEDDEGLPHSPCNSPTAADALDKTAIKDLPTKSHSTCSDGSLLSMGSSEMDEESFSQQSRHSSKLSLQEKDSDLELGPTSSSSTPLNHSAAHHRVSVRPKRRAPHRNRVPQLSSALPTTPEVNEESSIRSATPETTTREIISEHYSQTTFSETQLKCSSLPPGLAPPGSDPSKLNRSRSSAGSKSQDQFTTLEEDVEKEDKTDKSFFDRIFPRRSAKKRKSKEDKPPIAPSTIPQNYSKRVESKPVAAPRSGAASRQRIQPMELPPSPDSQKRDFVEPILPEKITLGSSPLHLELESRFKQRQMSTSLTPPPSPKSVISKVEIKESKIKIPGLSSLQQRVLSLNDELDDSGFKSLSDLPDEKPAKLVAKSQSFKSEEKFSEKRVSSVLKAASLDSVKVLDDDTPEPTNFDLVSEIFSDMNDVTISGPSHTAVVTVINSNTTDSFNSTKTEVTSSKESVSVTKIQLKRESVTQSTVQVPKNVVPEFFNRQLNKVEAKTTSNTVLLVSPRIIDEQSRPKNLFVTEQIPRKFSQEDIEIVEKSEEETPIITQPRFKKNENSKRKTSTSSTAPDSPSTEKPVIRSRSDSDNDSTDKSSQDSLDKLEDNVKEKGSSTIMESVVLRKKSLMKQKKDEEPELMKVFARRSLKLKDTDSEVVSHQINSMLEDSKSKDSDKENQAESPVEERKKSITSIKKEEIISEIREPLSETIERKYTEVVEVTLRKPPNSYGRSFSVNPPSEEKQGGFNERRITDNWLPNVKNGEDPIERKISQDEIMAGLSPKSDFINEEVLTERKNFIQRKAEWEKRAQEAQKKSVP